MTRARHRAGQEAAATRWRPMRSLLQTGAAGLLALGLLPDAVAQQTATTLYALNCMGCHLQPEQSKPQPLAYGAHFAHTDNGRVFFMRLPGPNEPRLTAAEDAELAAEIMTWKRSCSVILQQAPLVRYSGDEFVK